MKSSSSPSKQQHIDTEDTYIVMSNQNNASDL